MDFLKNTISTISRSASTFPYYIGEDVPINPDSSIWKIQDAVRKADNLSSTIFTFDIAYNPGRVSLAKNAAKRIRAFMLPGVLKVLDIYENDNTIRIVTERATPLSIYLQTLNTTNVNQKEKLKQYETFKWGIYNISKTLKQINDAGFTHGSLQISSIFVTESGEWKIGGFELVTPVSSNTQAHNTIEGSEAPEDSMLYLYSGLMPQAGRYAPPEASNGWDALRKSPPHSIDSWLLGLLIYQIFNDDITNTPSKLMQTKSIPTKLAQPYKKLISAHPRQRYSIAQFIESSKRNGAFTTDLINVTEQVENLSSIQEGESLKVFLEELEKVKDILPPNYARVKLLPVLTKYFEFGGTFPGVYKFIMSLLSQNLSTNSQNGLSTKEVEALVLPVINKALTIRTPHMKLAFVNTLPLYVDSLSDNTINNVIFPGFITGFTDPTPAVREATVKAVPFLISHLTARNINNSLLRSLAKTQNDSLQGIRTNTTICLGKIASYIGQNNRVKVLSAAFCKSLRDPFVHSRHAALLALKATIDYFSPMESAEFVLPSLCVSLLDKEFLVRDEASSTLNLFLKKVKDHAQTLPRSEDAESKQVLTVDSFSSDNKTSKREESNNSKINLSNVFGWYKLNDSSAKQSSSSLSSMPSSAKLSSDLSDLKVSNRKENGPNSAFNSMATTKYTSSQDIYNENNSDIDDNDEDEIFFDDEVDPFEADLNSKWGEFPENDDENDDNTLLNNKPSMNKSNINTASFTPSKQNFKPVATRASTFPISRTSINNPQNKVQNSKSKNQISFDVQVQEEDEKGWGDEDW